MHVPTGVVRPQRPRATMGGMYFDVKPCAVCGSDVSLGPRDAPVQGDGDPVGPADGIVGGADGTTDRRVCSNSDCPTRPEGGPTP
ncbi:MAG: hypothetical protein JWN68_806 [Nocardioides sp.]|jgi:hypothetical protein|nr:hypothetical protein [Nocardioides sp.]